MLPDQVFPSQLTPSQETPDQVLPDQVFPSQLTPSQDTPDQVLPSQETPDQVLPDQVLPDQVFPKMSISPSSITPSIQRREVPRDASMEPLPSDSWTDCEYSGTDADSAWPMSSRRETPNVSDLVFSAVLLSSHLTWSGVRSGRASSRSATAPETTAAACEVPVARTRSSPIRPASLNASENEPGLRRPTIDLPGALTSIFRLGRPSEVKSASVSPPASCDAPTAITRGE